MEETFGTVVIILAVVAAVVAAAVYVGSGRLYDGIGKGAFSLDQPDRPKGPQPGSAAYDAEAEAETRQMLEAKSALRVARGEEPARHRCRVRGAHGRRRPRVATRRSARRCASS